DGNPLKPVDPIDPSKGYVPPSITDPNDPSKDTPVPYEKDPEPKLELKPKPEPNLDPKPTPGIQSKSVPDSDSRKLSFVADELPETGQEDSPALAALGVSMILATVGMKSRKRREKD
ncbi:MULTISPECIES: LPXTG cell wall anchor domain-containing protein, partial [unclassified Streptococcus]|uniref:LPXTG cell wall anchor domain-containing protein n=1 Tax=unclassified Streptococcus TaxID=2608887 RepID=UPI001071F481